VITTRDALEQLASGDWISVGSNAQLTRIIIVLSLHQPDGEGDCLECGTDWPCDTFGLIVYGTIPGDKQ
jgi:hypothetical protein